MSFENAPISKGLMLGYALSSILVGIFDIKHYFHLQLVPHISRHHQYWRLFLHQFAFGNSSDLLVAEILLYNVSIQIERQFGTVKFASFAVVSSLISIILEFSGLLLFHRLGFNYIPAGPMALIFNILYQYSRIIPSIYQLRVFGVPVNNKIFTYLLAAQLAVSHVPGSAIVALLGVVVGQMYRSDLSNIKTYRLSPFIVQLSARFLLPLIGSTRPPRRSNRGLPDGPRQTPAEPTAEEVVTTAQGNTSGSGSTQNNSDSPENDTNVNSRTSVVREWVNELTGRADSANTGVRIPSEREISQVTSMFPDVRRDVIVGALQRSPNIESAVETLLSSQS